MFCVWMSSPGQQGALFQTDDFLHNQSEASLGEVRKRENIFGTVFFIMSQTTEKKVNFWIFFENVHFSVPPYSGSVKPVTWRRYAPLWTWSSLEPVTGSLKRSTSLLKQWGKEPLVLSGRQSGAVMDKKYEKKIIYHSFLFSGLINCICIL